MSKIQVFYNLEVSIRVVSVHSTPTHRLINATKYYIVNGKDYHNFVCNMSLTGTTLSGRNYGSSPDLRSDFRT